MQNTPPPLSSVTNEHATKWPKTIGIIAIVLGALGFFNGLMRLAGAWLSKVQMENMVTAKQADAEVVGAFLTDWMPLQIVSGIIFAVIAILLLTGGILLMKRRKLSVVIFRVWAVAYLVTGFLVAWKSLPMMSQQLDITMAQAMAGEEIEKATVETIANFSEIGAKIGLGINLVWTLACSLFFLIWFGRRSVREETKSWQ